MRGLSAFQTILLSFQDPRILAKSLFEIPYQRGSPRSVRQMPQANGCPEKIAPPLPFYKQTGGPQRVLASKINHLAGGQPPLFLKNDPTPCDLDRADATLPRLPAARPAREIPSFTISLMRGGSSNNPLPQNQSFPRGPPPCSHKITIRTRPLAHPPRALYLCGYEHRHRRNLRPGDSD